MLLIFIRILTYITVITYIEFKDTFSVQVWPTRTEFIVSRVDSCGCYYRWSFETDFLYLFCVSVISVVSSDKMDEKPEHIYTLICIRLKNGFLQLIFVSKLSINSRIQGYRSNYQISGVLGWFHYPNKAMAPLLEHFWELLRIHGPYYYFWDYRLQTKIRFCVIKLV